MLHAGARNSTVLFVYASIQKRAETMTPAWMTQLAERFRFDLPDALAGDGEVLAYFFQRVLAAILKTKTHLDNLLLARAESL